MQSSFKHLNHKMSNRKKSYLLTDKIGGEEPTSNDSSQNISPMMFKGVTTYHQKLAVKPHTAKSVKAPSSAAVLRQKQYKMHDSDFKSKQAEMLMRVERKSQNSEAIASYCDSRSFSVKNQHILQQRLNLKSQNHFQRQLVEMKTQNKLSGMLRPNSHISN